METININGREYVAKDEINQNTFTTNTEGLPFVCIRTYSAGVHFGYLKSCNGKVVELVDAIRVWYWAGACSLSELAINGSTKLSECKYAVTVPHIVLTEAIEIIDVTDKARIQMQEAKRWQSAK